MEGSWADIAKIHAEKFRYDYVEEDVSAQDQDFVGRTEVERLKIEIEALKESYRTLIQCCMKRGIL